MYLYVYVFLVHTHTHTHTHTHVYTAVTCASASRNLLLMTSACKRRHTVHLYPVPRTHAIGLQWVQQANLLVYFSRHAYTRRHLVHGMCSARLQSVSSRLRAANLRSDVIRSCPLLVCACLLVSVCLQTATRTELTVKSGACGCQGMSTSWEAEHAPQILRSLAADATSSIHDERSGSARGEYTPSLEASPINSSDASSTGCSSSSRCPSASLRFRHFSSDSEREDDEQTDAKVRQGYMQGCEQGTAACAFDACLQTAPAGRVSVADCSWVAGCAPKVRRCVNPADVQAAC